MFSLVCVILSTGGSVHACSQVPSAEGRYARSHIPSMGCACSVPDNFWGWVYQGVGKVYQGWVSRGGYNRGGMGVAVGIPGGRYTRGVGQTRGQGTRDTTALPVLAITTDTISKQAVRILLEYSLVSNGFHYHKIFLFLAKLTHGPMFLLGGVHVPGPRSLLGVGTPGFAYGMGMAFCR